MESITRESCLAWIAGGGIAPDSLREILEEKNDPIALYESFRRSGTLGGAERLPERNLQLLRDSCKERRLAAWQQLIFTHGIRALTCEDPEYPRKLQNLPDAPAILFYQGSLRALEKDSVSIVGSRSATWRGLDATRKIAGDLSRCGITIVSGLAAGIDAAAHQGCLQGGAPTIAVLGCGLDQQYPQTNAKLRAQIIEKDGLVLSEYAPGEKPLGWHFPYRNRIISGLGNCLVLMEARIRSGSMTSVQHALNQGKDVFVHPGEAGNLRCEGNHQLLREGAIYFTTAEDLMEDMGWLDKRQDVGQNSESSSRKAPGVTGAEKNILDELEKCEASFDELCSRLNLPAAQLNAALSMLQIQGWIIAMPGKIYARKTES